MASCLRPVHTKKAGVILDETKQSPKATVAESYCRRKLLSPKAT
jgi:hypothetical protein